MKKRTRKKSAKKKAVKKKAVRRRPRKAARKSAPRRAVKKAPRKARKPKGPKGPKKPPKKRPPKRKPPKKKPPKGRPPKKAPPPEPVLHEIVLQDPNGPDHVPAMSVSRGDQIRWFNETSVARMVNFTVWVFVEAEVTIVVPAGGVSPTYTLAPTTIYPRSFSYGIVPPFPGDSGPPDPPEVRADG